ncbi:bola-like protein [Biscogniauxia sp. FL1348]|nr:bola-like protein [Biscogniauxia sp. FL1348]
MLPLLRQKALATASRASQITEHPLRPLLLLQFSTTTMTSDTPVEDTIRAKITQAFNPSRLEIYNDSAKHAHHAPMRASASPSRETHFRLVITSAAFRAKPQPARHRLVYQLFRDEMAAEGGIHALQLRTMTPDEEQRLSEKSAAAATAAAAAAESAASAASAASTSESTSTEEESTREGTS